MPLDVALVNVTDAPAQIEVAPVTALTDVAVETVTVRVAVQPPEVM